MKLARKLNKMAISIINTENIEATEFSMEANVITLNDIPTIEEQEKLFNNDDSIVLCF